MFIEDGFRDCCDDIKEAKIEDGIFEEEEIDWIAKEKENYSFTVGEKEQMLLAEKSIKIR